MIIATISEYSCMAAAPQYETDEEEKGFDFGSSW